MKANVLEKCRVQWLLNELINVYICNNLAHLYVHAEDADHLLSVSRKSQMNNHPYFTFGQTPSCSISITSSGFLEVNFGQSVAGKSIFKKMK